MSVADQSDDKPKFPRLIICEGPEDRFFFQHLIEVRNLPRAHIQIANGWERLGERLDTFRITKTKTFRQLKHVVLVVDNDEFPETRFPLVQMQVQNVLGKDFVPQNPAEPTKTHPAISILTLPWTSRSGHLEQLCYEAAKDADKSVGKDTDDFIAVLRGSPKWSESRRSKAWLRCNLAARCDDPFIPLGKIFGEKGKHQIIPVSHKSFDVIASFLSKLT